MMRFRVLLPVLNACLLIVVAGLYVSSHGGIGGDYEFIGVGNDVVADKADVGQVLFNRWRLEPEREPVLVQLFMYLNLPSFTVAKLVILLLGYLIDEMDQTFPFGLSYSSYVVVLGAALSFALWYWVGRLAEQFRGRQRPPVTV